MWSKPGAKLRALPSDSLASFHSVLISAFLVNKLPLESHMLLEPVYSKYILSAIICGCRRRTKASSACCCCDPAAAFAAPIREELF